MKKFAQITAVALVAVLALTLLVACGYPSDPKKAEEKMEKQGYAAVYVPNVLPVGGVTGVLTGTKKEEGKVTTVVVTYYENSDSAKSAYKDEKAAADKNKDSNKEKGIKVSVSVSGSQVIVKTVVENKK